jgi:hypothetical protein
LAKVLQLHKVGKRKPDPQGEDAEKLAPVPGSEKTQNSLLRCSDPEDRQLVISLVMEELRTDLVRVEFTENEAERCVLSYQSDLERKVHVESDSDSDD